MIGATHSCGLDTVAACAACEQKSAAPASVQRDIIPDLGAFVDWVWALKAERDQLKAENQMLRDEDLKWQGLRDQEREIETLRARTAYWRQRAKSAEGHLFASDLQAACEALHKESNFAETPIDQLREWQKAKISAAVHAVLRAVDAQRDRRRPADFVAYRDDLASKVICDLDLFEDLRDSAATEADQHRQCMATYRPERQQLLDEIVERCDRLIADVTARRDSQNLTHQAE